MKTQCFMLISNKTPWVQTLPFGILLICQSEYFFLSPHAFLHKHSRNAASILSWNVWPEAVTAIENIASLPKTSRVLWLLGHWGRSCLNEHLAAESPGYKKWWKCSVCKNSKLFVALTLEMQRHCCCTLSSFSLKSGDRKQRPAQCGCLRKCHKRLRTVVGLRVRSLHCFVVYVFIPISGSSGGPGKWLIGPTYHPESFTCFCPSVSHLSFTAVSHHFHCCLLLDPFPLLLS